MFEVKRNRTFQKVPYNWEAYIPTGMGVGNIWGEHMYVRSTAEWLDAIDKATDRALNRMISMFREGEFCWLYYTDEWATLCSYAFCRVETAWWDETNKHDIDSYWWEMHDLVGANRIAPDQNKI